MGTDNPQEPQQPEQPPAAPPAVPPPPPEQPPAVPPSAPVPGGESIPSDAPAAGQPTPLRKSKLGLVLAIVLGVLIIAGGAFAGVMYTLRGTGDVLLDKVPDDALVFATAYLDPAAGQKLNIETVLGKFPAVNKEQMGQQFNQVMDQALSGLGLSFEEDVKPWLGTQVGVLVRMPGVSMLSSDAPGTALLIASKDDDAAKTALDKARSGPGLTWEQQQYKDASIWVGSQYSTTSVVYTMVDGAVVVAGDLDTAKAVVDAANGDTKSLADSSNYGDTMSALPKERVADLFVNGSALVDLMKNSPGFSTLPVTGGQDPITTLEAIRGVGMSVSFESDGVATKIAGLVDESKLPATGAPAAPHENAILAWTPQDAYGVMASTSFDQALKQMLSQLGPAMSAGDQMGLGRAVDSLSGDFGVVVTSGSTKYPGGALLLATKDQAAIQDFLDQISVLVSQAMTGPSFGGTESGGTSSGGTLPIRAILATPAWQTEDYQGVKISSLSIPSAEQYGIVPAYAVAKDMALIATSPEEIKKLIDAKGGSNVTSAPSFVAAMKHAQMQNTGLFYADIQNILGGIDAAVPPEDQVAFRTVKMNLAPLKALIVTSSESGKLEAADMFILIT